MKTHNLLNGFEKTKKIANIRVERLKSFLEENKAIRGNVVIDGRTLGCVNIRYKLKCKSANCYLIQKEIGHLELGYMSCHNCHLAFLNAYQDGTIQLKKQ